MGVDIIEDEKRRLIELALKAGKKRQSIQTGFVHFCYESDDEAKHDTIPAKENFCFILALLRSKQSEHISEAKLLLEKLLSFQVEGNFPVYLHEYPKCRDFKLSIHLWPALHRIFTEFSCVLGENLRESLALALLKLRNYNHSIASKKLLSESSYRKWSASEGTLDFSTWTPSHVEEWGEFLLALQLSPASFNKHPHLERALKHWHPNALTYVGPMGKSKYEKNHPALTLYDFFMSSLFNCYPQRILQDHPLHLQGALIYSFDIFVKPLSYTSPYVFGIHLEEEPFFCLTWGDKEHSCNLISLRKQNSLKTEISERHVELLYHFPHNLPEEDDERAEVVFFCNIHPHLHVLINQQRATVFELKDSIEIVSKALRFRLSFSLALGKGSFLGHISRGNRPSQISCRGNCAFDAYDIKIFLRTVSRDNSCAVNVKIEALENL